MIEDYQALLRHARLFGTEGIIDLVRPGDRARIRLELDAIDAQLAPRVRFAQPHKRRRRAPEETLDAVAALRNEGLVPAAIADKLGVSDDYVRKCLTKVRKAGERTDLQPLSGGKRSNADHIARHKAREVKSSPQTARSSGESGTETGSEGLSPRPAGETA